MVQHNMHGITMHRETEHNGHNGLSASYLHQQGWALGVLSKVRE